MSIRSITRRAKDPAPLRFPRLADPYRPDLSLASLVEDWRMVSSSWRFCACLSLAVIIDIVSCGPRPLTEIRDKGPADSDRVPDPQPNKPLNACNSIDCCEKVARVFMRSDGFIGRMRSIVRDLSSSLGPLIKALERTEVPLETTCSARFSQWNAINEVLQSPFALTNEWSKEVLTSFLTFFEGLWGREAAEACRPRAAALLAELPAAKYITAIREILWAVRDWSERVVGHQEPESVGTCPVEEAISGCLKPCKYVIAKETQCKEERQERFVGTVPTGCYWSYEAGGYHTRRCTGTAPNIEVSYFTKCEDVVLYGSEVLVEGNCWDEVVAPNLNHLACFQLVEKIGVAPPLERVLVLKP